MGKTNLQCTIQTTSMAVVVVECALLTSLCPPAIIIVWYPNHGIQKVHDTVIKFIVLSSNSCHDYVVPQCWSPIP
jgi:hypothetical protein